MAGIDYLDEDVAYLLGLLVARGELISSQSSYRILLRFPKSYLPETNKDIQLGIERIRERILTLTGGDAQPVEAASNWETTISLTRNTMVWRNLLMLLENRTSFHHFRIPSVLFEQTTPIEYKREFVRGYADVAGSIRESNYDRVGRHRVYLDTLNYPTNWQVPVQLCLLLQDHLSVPVPLILWGHPNVRGRGEAWKEHQVRVYAEDFSEVGFYFPFKQQQLERLAQYNLQHFTGRVKGCPGERPIQERKPRSPEERNAEKLPGELLGKHFDRYWQICRALGCPRRPGKGAQLELISED